MRNGEPRVHCEPDPARQTKKPKTEADITETTTRNSPAAPSAGDVPAGDSSVQARHGPPTGTIDSKGMAAVVEESRRIAEDTLAEQHVKEAILDSRLHQHGRRCDVTTPRDGDCLFHALKSMGFVDSHVTVPEMRQKALLAATEEELCQAAALTVGVSTEDYVEKMLGHEYADPCALQWLCRAFGKPAITMVSPSNVRSWTATSEEDGPHADAFWVAFDGDNHYCGTFSL